MLTQCTQPVLYTTVSWSADYSWEDALHELQADILAFSRLGEVCVMGDLNAHTGDLDDRGEDGQGVLDAMGTMNGSPDASPHTSLAPRHTSDLSPACPAGRSLIDMCVSTGCVLLNGRAPGDPAGAPTFVGHDGTACGVIDYAIVSKFPFFSC